MKSKTIIISNEKSPARGILTLFFDNDMIKCKIRLYGMDKLSPTTKIGIYHGEKVYSANLIYRENCYHSSLVGDFDPDGDFYCALVETRSGNNVLLSGGTYAGYYFNGDSVFESPALQEEHPPFPSNESPNPSNENNPEQSSSPADNASQNPQHFLETPPREENLDFSPASQNDEAQAVPQSVFENAETAKPSEHVSPAETEDSKMCAMCENCQYKAYFYGENIKFNLNSEPIEPHDGNEDISDSETATSSKASQTQKDETSAPEKEDEKDKKILPPYESIVSQFKYVFENYEPNEELNARVENSKFAKMNEGENEYSIGAIYDDPSLKTMKYICYAVKSFYNTPAPEELGNFYQWLPLDLDDPLSDGYYLVYQDAKDLKIIE